MSAAEHQDYIQSKINPLLEALVTQLLLDKPDDPAPYMVSWLCKEAKLPAPGGMAGATMGPPQHRSSVNEGVLQEEIGRLKEYIRDLEAKCGIKAPPEEDEHHEEDDEDDEDEEDEDTVEEMPAMPPKAYASRGPRQSVSAEAYGKWNQKKAFVAPVYQKGDDQKARIQAVLEQSFLFRNLEEKDMKTVIDAMQEKVVSAGTRIIQQGDDGDCLFVVESGTIDCYKKFPGEDDEKLVKVCQSGDAFGELALLYNCPRAASVNARDNCVLWQLDRESFNHIVKEAASKKRELYEGFLKKVPLLESMDAYERSKIADALKTETYKDGDVIVSQGEPGDKFYIVEEGKAVATKSFVQGQSPQEVMQFGSGDYFGELALLKNEPRAANVIAKSDLRVAALDRRSFKRLLGNLEDILKRNTARYE
ncbi:unnamed protein product [Vitrella brassicaformis CCMP3155]|uniref:cAMP-dependent protein kinase regulatory subunit n=2 Tax=Vitrella brassicaformis TaxID=1169539 RepID=A0A0G4F309_VITBC|nr:unnamed protein product [Vitrella brassicaformis CCMP3155]|mmetsp:Transcript_20720/g.59122  ORF Transcript_20720/g.59122 Transcript_20720/m.59122 type:complete len:420 (+) Transcript_20720:64-1323(+)|eukprot:CEM06144.1 unnamed protein product [Vitrella brassicaformis CCMP3155]